MQVTDEMVRVAMAAYNSDCNGVRCQGPAMRQALTAALAAMTEHYDKLGYDPHGPEVHALHYWFADNGQQWKWHDDGCRSEQARDLLNHLAKAGLIVVPVPRPT